MPPPSPPPVPQKLREMLEDYPEHICRLQEVLDYLVETPSAGVDPFDRAIWLLEGRLETFKNEARKDLKAAEASGNAETIARAKMKISIFGAVRADMGPLTDLKAHFTPAG